jgi:hypothetical protein
MKLGLIFGLIFVFFTGCSSGGSGDAMPITQDNINKYAKKMSVSAKAVSMGDSNIEKAIQIYKVPLEDMGYDFDATIINTVKVLQKAGYTSLSTTVMKMILPILHIVNENPELVVEKGLVSEDTKDKILMYNKFHEMKPEVMQALQYVETCQNDNNDICTIKQYVKILLDSKFLSPHENYEYKTEFLNLSVDNVFYKVDEDRRSELAGKIMMADGKENKVKAQKEYDEFEKNVRIYQDVSNNYQSRFNYKVPYREFGKYLIHQNGKKVNANGFIAIYTKPFKLKDGTIEQLKNYNPWWLN